MKKELHTDSTTSSEQEEPVRLALRAFTRSGKRSVDDETWKIVKTFVTRGDEETMRLMRWLWADFIEEHGQIRYASLLLIDRLSIRSRVIRCELLGKLEEFMRLTMGIKQYRLPPPESSHDDLRRKALTSLHQWYLLFGDQSKELKLAHDYLEFNYHVDFANVETSLRKIDRIEDERHEQDRERDRVKLEASMKALKDMEREMESTFREMDACFELLLPHFEDVTATTTPRGLDQPSITSLAQTVREDALGSSSYSLTIRIPRQLSDLEDDENRVMFDALRDAYKVLMRHYVPSFSKHLRILTKFGGSQQLVRRTIDQKDRLTRYKDRCEMLGITSVSTLASAESLSRKSAKDDDDVDDVDYENDLSDDAEIFLEIKPVVDRPSTSAATASRGDSISRISNQESTAALSPPDTTKSAIDPRPIRQDEAVMEPSESSRSLREALLAEAPVVPFHNDLYYWGKKQVDDEETGFEELHRFWTGHEKVEEETHHQTSREKMDLLHIRPVYYEPVRPHYRECRAPLKDGRLCGRRDALQCPFHGPIVARDTRGVPVDTSSAPDLAPPPPVSGPIPAWQHIENEVNQIHPMPQNLKSKRHKLPKRQSPQTLIEPVCRSKQRVYDRLDHHLRNRSSLRRVYQDAERLEDRVRREKSSNKW